MDAAAVANSGAMESLAERTFEQRLEGESGGSEQPCNHLEELSKEAGEKGKWEGSGCGRTARRPVSPEQRVAECSREELREVIYRYTPMSLFQWSESQFPFAEVNQHKPVLSMCPGTGGHSEAWHSETSSVTIL